MKSFEITKFGWVNKADNQSDLKDYEASDLLNVRLDWESTYRRSWTSVVWTGLTLDIKKLQECKDDFFATDWWQLKKKNGDTWESVLTGLDSSWMIRLIESEVFTYSYNIWTVTAEDTYRTSITLSNSFADNVLLWKYIVIGNEVRKIIANTSNVVIVADSFLNELTWYPYAIKEFDEWVIVFNGIDQPKKTTDFVTFNNVNNIPFFKHVCVYQNRIIGVTSFSSTLHISTIFNGEDYPYTLDVNKNDGDYITWIKVFGNQLVIFKNKSVWISEFDSPTEATLIQRADNFGCVNSETIDIVDNILFFLSHRGLEWFNQLETNALEWHMCLSDYKLPQIWDEDSVNACWVWFDWKFYLSFPDNNRVYIFDTAIYLKTWGRKTFLIDEGYSASCFGVFDWELYFWWVWNVFDFSWDDDNGISFSSFWKSKKISLKDKKRNKILRLINISLEWYVWSEIVKITDKTEKEEKALEDKVLNKWVVCVSWKRTKWKDHLLSFDLSQIWAVKIESAEFLFELWKI